MSDLPPRLQEAEWKRWVEREIRRRFQGVGGGSGVSEAQYVSYDENNVPRVQVGQIGTESNPDYGIRLNDEDGNPIPFGGGTMADEIDGGAP